MECADQPSDVYPLGLLLALRAASVADSTHKPIFRTLKLPSDVWVPSDAWQGYNLKTIPARPRQRSCSRKDQHCATAAPEVTEMLLMEGDALHQWVRRTLWEKKSELDTTGARVSVKKGVKGRRYLVVSGSHLAVEQALPTLESILEAGQVAIAGDASISTAGAGESAGQTILSMVKAEGEVSVAALPEPLPISKDDSLLSAMEAREDAEVQAKVFNSETFVEINCWSHAENLAAKRTLPTDGTVVLQQIEQQIEQQIDRCTSEEAADPAPVMPTVSTKEAIGSVNPAVVSAVQQPYSAAEKAATEKVAAEKTAAKKATEEKAAAEKAAAEKVAAEKAAAKKAAADKAAADKAAAEEAAAEKAAAKKTAIEKAAAEKAAALKAAAQKAAQEKAAAEKAAAEKAAAEKAAAEKAAAEKAAAKRAAMEKAVAEKAAAEKAVASKAAAERAAMEKAAAKKAAAQKAAAEKAAAQKAQPQSGLAQRPAPPPVPAWARPPLSVLEVCEKAASATNAPGSGKKVEFADPLTDTCARTSSPMVQKSSNIEEWACSACTLLNPKTAKTCALCEEPRRVPSPPPRVSSTTRTTACAKKAPTTKSSKLRRPVELVDPLPQRNAKPLPAPRMLTAGLVVGGVSNANAASGPRWAERPAERLNTKCELQTWETEEEDPSLACYLWDRQSDRPKVQRHQRINVNPKWGLAN